MNVKELAQSHNLVASGAAAAVTRFGAYLPAPLAMLNLFSTKGWEPYYKGKHVLITGASEGVGLTLAKRLVAAGARVTLMARTKSKLVAAEAACLEQQPAGAQQQAPRRTFLAPADVTNEEEVTKAVTDAQAALGQVDVLIACAGGARCGEYWMIEHWEAWVYACMGQ